MWISLAVGNCRDSFQLWVCCTLAAKQDSPPKGDEPQVTRGRWGRKEWLKQMLSEARKDLDLTLRRKSGTLWNSAFGVRFVMRKKWRFLR